MMHTFLLATATARAFLAVSRYANGTTSGKTPKRAAWYLNRWRLSDFKAPFERAGFHILKLDVNATFPAGESVRRTLDARFQKYSLEDLSPTGVIIIARKEQGRKRSLS